ncbi:MAG: insulinase family protein, partial [Nannocystaceae bacterium]
LEEDAVLGAALRDYASFGERSPRLARPSNAGLMRAQPKALRRLVQSWLSYEHDVLYYGPRSADEAAAILDRKTAPRSPGKPWVDRYRRVDETTVFFLHEDGAKATVWLVDPQPPLPRGERAVAELYEQVMDGNSGSLVFQEIREARGLAYSAWLSHREGRTAADESAVLGGMSTQADKTPESVRTYLELLARPMQADRFDEAKGALDQVYRASRIDPRQLPYWVQAWDDAGDPEDPRRGQWEALRSTTLADVEAFAQRVRSRPLIIAVIGDRERVGLPQLRQLGPVVEVQASDLFSYGPFPPLEPESNGAAGQARKGS